jgi:hypothetical protein
MARKNRAETEQSVCSASRALRCGREFYDRFSKPESRAIEGCWKHAGGVSPPTCCPTSKETKKTFNQLFIDSGRRCRGDGRIREIREMLRRLLKDGRIFLKDPFVGWQRPNLHLQ